MSDLESSHEHGPNGWNDLDRGRARRAAARFLADAKQLADWSLDPEDDYIDEAFSPFELAQMYGVNLAESYLVKAFGAKCDSDVVMSCLWAVMGKLLDHPLFERDEARLRAGFEHASSHLIGRAADLAWEADRNRPSPSQLASHRRLTDPRRGRR
jgi:hypothetical protein